MIMVPTTVFISVLVCIAPLFLSGSNAYTPPFVFRASHRDGTAYQEALETHTMLHEMYGLHHRNVTQGVYSQRISHDDPSLGTFQQRYWMDLKHLDASDIAFLYINGEAPGAAMDGYAAMLADEFQATAFSLEHRFYGKSMPFPLTDRMGLRHLTVENALADLVGFMDYVEGTLVRRKLRWVSVGGSYAGALSAWLKVRYPNRLVAAWSSSGVVHAKFDFTAFDGHIVNVLPFNCLNTTQALLKTWEELYDNPDTRAELLDNFGTPSYFTKTEMAWILADNIILQTQYSKKTKYCDMISGLPGGDDAVFGLYKFVKYMKDTMGNKTFAQCSYSTKCMSDPAMSDQWAASGYAWIYQTCSQLAYWQVAYPNSLRHASITTDFFIQQCQDVFGDTTFPNVFTFNRMYGGEKPNANHVIALQGSDDPWIEVGVQKKLNPTYIAYVAQCDDCGHCGDLGLPKDTDPSNLRAQRQFIREVLRNWLYI